MMAFSDLETIGEMFELLSGSFDYGADLSFSSRPYQRTFVRVDWRRVNNERAAREPLSREEVKARNRQRMGMYYDSAKRHARHLALMSDPVAHAAHLAYRRAHEADEAAKAARRERERVYYATAEGKAVRAARQARYYQRRKGAV
jgi:hypothetical protein